MKKKKNDLLDFDVMEHWIDDDKPSTKGNEELSLFEESLADYIKGWQETKKDPLLHRVELKADANVLISDILDPIPCWRKFRNGGPLSFENGLLKTPMGTALIHGGWYVFVEDLVERLPRTIEE